MASFLNLEGLTHFWSKAKSYIDSSISSAKTTVDNYTVNGKKISTNPTISKSDVGLSNVTNDAQVKRSEIGKANGVASLDAKGKISSGILPLFFDDFLEYSGNVSGITISIPPSTGPVVVGVYFDTIKKAFVAKDAKGKFYTAWAERPGIPASEAFGTTTTNGVIPIVGKIYVDTIANKASMWSGSELLDLGNATDNLHVIHQLLVGDTSRTAASMKGSIFLSGSIIHNPLTGASKYQIIEGNASFSGQVVCKALTYTSDERFKENIHPISTDTEKINDIEFKEFNFVEDTSGRKSYGVLAQDLERVGLENLVYENEEGIKSVDYTSLVMLELQRLRNEIKELKAAM